MKGLAHHLNLLGLPFSGHHRLGGLNHRNRLSHSSGGWKSKLKVGASWVGSF